MLILNHPWVRVDSEASDKPIDIAVLSRTKQFRAMNKLKKVAHPSDNRGTITYEELMAGLPKLGTRLSESEFRQLIEAANVAGNGTIDYIVSNGYNAHESNGERRTPVHCL